MMGSRTPPVPASMLLHSLVRIGSHPGNPGARVKLLGRIRVNLRTSAPAFTCREHPEQTPTHQREQAWNSRAEWHGESLCTRVWCTYVYLHLEARVLQQVSPSSPHFWRQGLSLGRKLTDLARLASMSKRSSIIYIFYHTRLRWFK